MTNLIHIGYLKTGTTWMQKNFFPLVRNAYFFNPDEFNKNFIRNNKLSSEIIQNKHKINIISQENILGGAIVNENKRIDTAKRLKSAFHTAKIIIFIRKQNSLISSAYSTYLKMGGTKPIKDYLFSKRKNGRFFNLDFFKYNNKFIQLYSELFGAQNIYYFCYERFLEDNRTFLKRFSELFSLDIDLNSVDYSFINKRIRERLVKWYKIMNLFSKSPFHFKDTIIEIPYLYQISRRILEIINYYPIFGNNQNDEAILGESIYQYLTDYYKESNRLLIKEKGITDIFKYDYPL